MIDIILFIASSHFLVIRQKKCNILRPSLYRSRLHRSADQRLTHVTYKRRPKNFIVLYQPIYQRSITSDII